jgi:hypothetical protein
MLKLENGCMVNNVAVEYYFVFKPNAPEDET